MQMPYPESDQFILKIINSAQTCDRHQDFFRIEQIHDFAEVLKKTKTRSNRKWIEEENEYAKWMRFYTTVKSSIELTQNRNVNNGHTRRKSM